MIQVRVQWSIGSEWLPATFDACPRKDEYVFWRERRFRVCQVQHRMVDSGFTPHLILQEEFQ